MPTVRIPANTFSVRSPKPKKRFGAPGRLPLKSGTHEALLRWAWDKVPDDAVITSCVLEVTVAVSSGATHNLQVYGVNANWGAQVRWEKKPPRGATLLAQQSKASPAVGATYSLDLTSWAGARPANGIYLVTTNAAAKLILRGSTAAASTPTIVIGYTIPADTPAGLVPDGGAVSVAKPDLSFVGDPELTEFNIQINDGTTTWDSGWIPASEGYYVQPPAAPASAIGQSITWRVRDRAGSGTSPWSEWATYSYRPLPVVVITSPGATTPDGSPTVSWTASAQAQWKTEFRSSTRLVDDSDGWNMEPATRDWSPSKSIKVPNGQGRMIVWVRDNYVRVAAPNAPTVTKAVLDFATVVSGGGPGVTGLNVTMDGPTPVIRGVRAAGTPDEVALLRDGEMVPLWDEDGDPGLWVPGTVFFTGTEFAIPDYTSPPRNEHTWQIRVRTNGVPTAASSGVTADISTNSVFLIDPTTGERIEIFDPAIEQTTSEASILHTPVSGDLIVAPVRRRLMRTTRMGSVVGTIFEGDEDILNDWVLGPAGNRYRLVFGKKNLLVIIGDYSPSDLEGYRDKCEPDQLYVAFNWWERLGNW